MARVTVKTLAAQLGVSASTVSNAYNRPDQLSAELRQRILTAAAELGYAGPDAAGRALRVGRAQAVGVLLNERLSYAFSDPFAVEFLTGISEVAEEHEISVVLMPLSVHREVTSVRRASIDAMTILSLPPTHPAAQVARARGIRLVTTDANPDPDSSWAAIDDELAGRLIGQHLVGLGHRTVTVVADDSRPAAAPPQVITDADIPYVDATARLRGLRQVIPGRVVVVSSGHNAIASGVSAGRWLADSDELPTAIVGLSDVLALGVLEALDERGLVAPADISVCGFDDVPAAAAADLTTVRQPIRERGREIGRLLVDPDSEPRQVRLPVELITRATSGPSRV